MFFFFSARQDKNHNESSEMWFLYVWHSRTAMNNVTWKRTVFFSVTYLQRRIKDAIFSQTKTMQSENTLTICSVLRECVCVCACSRACVCVLSGCVCVRVLFILHKRHFHSYFRSVFIRYGKRYLFIVVYQRVLCVLQYICCAVYNRYLSGMA